MRGAPQRIVLLVLLGAGHGRALRVRATGAPAIADRGQLIDRHRTDSRVCGHGEPSTARPASARSSG